MASDVEYIFVYGTLKRGQVRESCWPRRPLDVIPAYSLGRLYDLGSYPAMVAGEDKVLGELWAVAPSDLEATLETLDQIEGYHDRPDDLYKRVTVDCWELLDGDQANVGSKRAFTYFYCVEADLAVCNRIQSQEKPGMCCWPAGRTSCH